ncbi:MAG: DegQ family serine endoprotease [Fretibacterium sp.]|nr:DegQ family serine endoprotease [Fretibacterium sp.]
MKRNVLKRGGALLLAGVLILGGAPLLGTQMALAAPSGVGEKNPVVSIVKSASPAVVNIDVETKVKQRSPFPFGDDPFFREFFGDIFRDYNRTVPMKGRGSGFIVSKDGQILTNNHVIEGVDKISVTLADGKSYPAKVLGKDPTFDLAVIKITPKGDLPVLELGDSDETEVGEWVVAIGNPYGLEHTVTVGVVSAKNRSIHAQNVNFDGFIQTDAAINPGNSGGPLLNMEGKVVGINTAILPFAQGLGFAVPVNMAKQIMDDLVAYGKVKRGWLGISVQNLTPELAGAYEVESETGVIVGDVFSGSAAEKAGIQTGDVIIKVDGSEVKDTLWFVNKIREKAPGSTVKLTLVREGREISLTAKLNERPEDADGPMRRSDAGQEPVGKALEKVGLSVAELTQDLRQRFRLDSNRDGLVVVRVAPGSSADAAGLRSGDLLLQVNGRKVANLEQLNQALARKSKAVVLLVERGGRTFFIALEERDEKDE